MAHFTPIAVISTGNIPPSTTTRDDFTATLPGLLPFYDRRPEIVYTQTDPSFVVQVAVTAVLKLGIRSGGNEMLGRNLTGTYDGILLDMRSMNSVTIAVDRRSANIGGRILIGQLVPARADPGYCFPGGFPVL